ncbi:MULTISPECIES: hypothetical protein [unclassified Mesorhizobium]|uniref:hypothetical protein n=1 Tax=unclassified Mesorhizobium TaxID=325217 RepID=UPI000F74CDA5|nr:MULTISPECIES: hypothetical protein [unclassified Mesorhizobium]TGT57114.1 hypothetical protein EN813_040130 [Mesorhizobium sp. M00.F.Ca.ET.170.01.1.1]AZO10704.1 hypothetical protein EJ074_17355 [Mesorhizobium sp. M3A.F.Ca.ET.080.04.2.1]RWB70563.1 MAG: hypothetical protein EOQ49_17240 [Mesorhizobium sp.]RWB92538.1 MAG: hypothetical protein EOQ52_03285 [Mesorhizobium sp.]RWE24282.1 MAG: hypothetical protein EOS41_17115 [Mesorhizobium sp.]
MRLILLLSFLTSLASSTLLAKEVYHNVASRDSLIRANILGSMMNALTLHKEFDDKCNLVPLIDIKAFENYYKNLTWSLSPSDLALVQKTYLDAQSTWRAKDGGIPGIECDDLSAEILDFDIGTPNPRQEMLSLLNATPRGSSQYRIYAAAVAWGGYLGASITCPDYSVSSVAVNKIQESNRDEFRVPYLLARLAAAKAPPSCRDIAPFARDGGVYRARSK